MLEAVVSILIVALLLWGVRALRVYPAIGAGYRAKIVCTGVFGSGRAFDETLRTQVADDSYRILRPFRVEVDPAARQVTASLLGRFARTAVHRPGLGATLISGAPLVGSRTSPRATTGGRDWPAAGAPRALIDVVQAAFTEPNPSRLRRTYAVVVIKDGRLVAERYAPGFSPEMPLPGWSVTKSVLNALVGIAVSQGLLSLDQRDLMPQWPAGDSRSAITVEDLLRMRTGLRFSEAYGNPWSDVLHMLYNCHDTAAYAAGLPLASPVGSTWSYSSGTTNILSYVLRRAVGDERYFEWPQAMLFDPLGMTSAVMEPDGAGTFVCSSYMLATARDWARFGQLFVDGGMVGGRQLLPADWVRFSTTPTSQSPDGRFGAHWWLKLNPEIGGDTPAAARIEPDAFFAIGHEGQTLTVIPSKRLVVVRLGASIYIDAWDQASFIADIQDAA